MSCPSFSFNTCSWRRASASGESRFSQSRHEHRAGLHLTPRLRQTQYFFEHRPFLHVQGFKSSATSTQDFDGSAGSLLNRGSGCVWEMVSLDALLIFFIFTCLLNSCSTSLTASVRFASSFSSAILTAFSWQCNSLSSHFKWSSHSLWTCGRLGFRPLRTFSPEKVFGTAGD